MFVSLPLKLDQPGLCRSHSPQSNCHPWLSKAHRQNCPFPKVLLSSGPCVLTVILAVPRLSHPGRGAVL